MGIREWTEKHPKAIVSLVGACIAITLVTVVVQVRAGRRTITTQVPDTFFTVDDGRTFFAASGSNIPPFDYKGQEAVTAYVFECSGKQFVAYMERFTPEAHKLMVENKATPATQIYGRELKKPGSSTWIKSGDVRAVAELADVHCPDGGSGIPEPVQP
jgi:hypothetical protein